jgi:hypothetical protein
VTVRQPAFQKTGQNAGGPRKILLSNDRIETPRKEQSSRASCTPKTPYVLITGTHEKDRPMTNAKPRRQAIDAFLAAKADIDQMLARLEALSADHFDVHPDEVDWGHVGTLDDYRTKLRQITDAAFKEGEHAL